MSEYLAKINWKRTADEAFVDNQYSRGHLWSFDGGASVSASSSPHIVPLPFSVEANVDPEEAFFASISSDTNLIKYVVSSEPLRFFNSRRIDEEMHIPFKSMQHGSGTPEPRITVSVNHLSCLQHLAFPLKEQIFSRIGIICYFLGIAAKIKWLVDEYQDNALGGIGKDEYGNMTMTKVIFSGQKQPTSAQLEKVHNQSHQQCFIANSVKTEMVIEIVL